MTEPTDLDKMHATSDALHSAVEALLLEHDGRVVLACMLAEVALLAAAFRQAKLMNIEFICGMFNESLSTALTYVPKAKIVYTDGSYTGSKQ